MINLTWVKERLVIFLLIILIFLPPTFLLGGYTFYSLTLIESLVILTGLIGFSGKIKIIKSCVHLPILFFMLSAVLSTINSHYLRGSWEEITKLACCLIFFLMVGNYLSTHLKLFVPTLVLTTLVVLSLSLNQFLIHIPKSLIDRLYYPLGNPNLLAGFLVITIPLMVRLFFIVRFRFLFGLLLLFSFLTLYFTSSRGSVLGVIGALFFLFFITRQNRRRYGFILLSGLFIVIVGVIIYNLFSPSHWLGTHSIFQRFYIWKYSCLMFLDHFILGVGPGAYANVFFDYRQDVPWHYHSHNIFIQYACEMGIIGLLSFIWLLVSLFKEGFKTIVEENTYEKAVREGLLASLIGLLIHNQGDYLFWIPVFQLYFWLILGILTFRQGKEYIFPNTYWLTGIIIIFCFFCIFRPFSGYVFFNQGVILADKGRWEAAKLKFEKAVAFDFYHPVYHAHLATSYTKIQPASLNLAIKEYEIASSLDNSKAYFKKEKTLCWKLYRRRAIGSK
ncbi:MAG: O-antigen ligase family protein [bacterium]